MSDDKLNILIEKLQQHLEVELLFGEERVECRKSVFKDLKKSDSFLIKGKKELADIMFVMESSSDDGDNDSEKDTSKLLKKIIEALKYKEEEVLVMTLKKYVDLFSNDFKKNINSKILDAKPKKIIFMGEGFREIICKDNEKVEISLNSVFKYYNIPSILIYDLSFMIKNPESKKAIWKAMLELTQIK